MQLDIDRNPYNNNSRNLDEISYSATPSSTRSSLFTGNLAGVSPGRYYLCLKITNALGLTRYDYWPTPIQVLNQNSLTIQSSGANGISINVSPADISGRFSGLTPFNLSYAPAGGVSITAPMTVGTTSFSGWLGVDNQSGNIGFVTMNANRIVTAIYQDNAVSVTITSPTSAPGYTTGSSTAHLHGTALGIITNVSWQNLMTGASGVATGMNVWDTFGISLHQGDNTILVTATDIAGRSGSDSIVVTFDNSAASVTLHAVSSAFVMSGNPAKNYGNGSDLWAGYSSYSTDQKERTLVRFDLSSIPPGSTLSSASVGLYLNGIDPPNAVFNTIGLYRITGSWTESGVTWNNQPGYTSTGGTSLALGSALNRYYYWDATSIVADWLGGTHANNGFILVSNLEGPGTDNDRGFGSSRYTRDPLLKVTYIRETIPPTITIVTPTPAASLSYTNISSSIMLAGTSSDNYIVSSVSWTNSATGQSGIASGTTSWTATVSLNPGWNAVTVIATDSAGNTGNDVIEIDYVVPDTNPPAVPGTVLASALSSTEAQVIWSPSMDSGGSGFKEYRIFRNGVARASSPFSTFIDSGLLASSTFCYTIVAVDYAGNESGPSSSACISTALPSQPVLRLAQTSPNSTLTLNLESAAGYTYIVESSVDLQTWRYVTSIMCTNENTVIVVERSPSLEKNFYRVTFAE